MKGFGRWVILCLTVVCFFAPLKFGTAVVLPVTLTPAADVFDWLFFSWPNQLATLFCFGALLWLVLDPNRVAARVDFLFVLPLLFLATQLLAMTGSIAPQASTDTLLHFATCVLLFYSAAWYVRDGGEAAWIFGGLGLGMSVVCVCALDQRYGFYGASLADTRRYVELYVDPASLPVGLDRRLLSDRVFAWFGGYPNALAGYLVVVFAPTLAWIWTRARMWVGWMRWGTMVFAGGLMLFCLALTGSRGGFMAFAAMVMAGLFCLVPKGSRRTWWVVVTLVAIAVVFILAERAGFVRLGTSSVSARRDYWRGAVAIARDHPWVGTGPGTFGSIYPMYKTAISMEEPQMAHNSFLQMWSDSGLPGFVMFALLWLVALRDAFQLARSRYGDAASIAVCAALAGWVVHGVMDFDLYVPGVALPAFVLLGVLQGLKELPDVQLVPAMRVPRPVMGLVCAVVVGFVFWWDGRSLLANLAQAQAHQLARLDPVAAAESAQRAISLSPRNPYYHAAAGDLAVASENFSAAIDSYEQAVGCDPFRASYHWRLAPVLMRTAGRESEAIEQLQLAVRLNPTKEAYRDDLRAAEESIRQPPPLLLESAPTKPTPDPVVP